MVEISLTVGKLDASLALLLTKDQHLIEFPTILLPDGVRAGLVVKIKCEQDIETEVAEAEQFRKLQQEIVNTFGSNLPLAPKLRIRNVTQTSCVLEWDPLDLGSSSLKNLVMYKDGKKLGLIAQPLVNRTSKLSGLPIDKKFLFQLRLDTTSGVYLLDVVEVTTHKMTDLSGITVCLGDFSPNDPFSVEDLNDVLAKIGANCPGQDRIKVDTTHFLCTRENKSNPEFIKAMDMNIPVVRPEWLKACERERRIVGVRDFYVKDCVLPDILAQNFWADLASRKGSAGAPTEGGDENAPENATHTDTNKDHPAPETPAVAEKTHDIAENSSHAESSDTPQAGIKSNLLTDHTEPQTQEPAIAHDSQQLELAQAHSALDVDGKSEFNAISQSTDSEQSHNSSDTPKENVSGATKALETKNDSPTAMQTETTNGQALQKSISPELGSSELNNLSQASLVDEPIGDGQVSEPTEKEIDDVNGEGADAAPVNESSNNEDTDKKDATGAEQQDIAKHADTTGEESDHDAGNEDEEKSDAETETLAAPLSNETKKKKKKGKKGKK